MYIGWRGSGLQSVVTAASARKDGSFLFAFCSAGCSRSILLGTRRSSRFFAKGKEKEPGTRMELPLNCLIRRIGDC